MRTPVKLLFWLFGAISTLLAVLVALLFFVDVNLYRTQIEHRVSAAFDRKVVIEGPLELGRSLTPRFVVRGLKISNPEWASRQFLAVADSFDIRVSLIPLLRGKLEIHSLEFHGVDVLLETTSDGSNNFTFAETGSTAGFPAIEHISLIDAAIAYAAPGMPVRRVHAQKITGRKVPGQPLSLDAYTTVNTVPLKISLEGEPPGKEPADKTWQFTLVGTTDNTSLQVRGSIADPIDLSHGEYQLELKGRNLDDIEALSDMALPGVGAHELSATVRYQFGEHLSLSDLTGHIGSSDIQGNLHWDMSTSPPVIGIRLESQQLDTADLGLAGQQTPGAGQPGSDFPDMSFDTGRLAAVDLDIEIQVQQLNGLKQRVRDILLNADADRQRLRLATIKATLDKTNIEANAVLPWGERLTSLTPGAAGIKTLLQHTELYIRAQTPDPGHDYSTTLLGRPLDLNVNSIEATARPGQPLNIKAEAALNSKPVSINLKAESLPAYAQRPAGPWKDLKLEARGEDIYIDASGSVARPLEAGGLDIGYTLSSGNISTLLPLQGAWSLSGRYADHEDRSEFDELKMRLGRSDISGRIALYRDGRQDRLVANLNANRIDLAEFLPDSTPGKATGNAWDQPLGINGLINHDLDIDIRVRDLQGLDTPVQDIQLLARASQQTMRLSPLEVRVDGIPLDGTIELPWGENLDPRGNRPVSLQTLTELADVRLNARPPQGKLKRHGVLMGHPLDIELTKLKASARPGKPLQVSAEALLDDTPLQLALKAQPLAVFMQRPAGPWKQLVLEAQADDVRFNATGSIAHPFEFAGFDIDYVLHGAAVDSLLPVFNLMLPLEGAYSLSGHFTDRHDRLVFDELKIKSGRSDINGKISVYRDTERPRVIANLRSRQIYLSKLLPVSEASDLPYAEPRVIPDYTLPVERFREIDGEISFQAERLRTSAGDLGDIRFKATLQDGVFRMEDFEVQGWAGARIESDIKIDARQNPPAMEWQWIARQLNYGVLLEQAGFAETVEGTIDVTLRLSGSGQTRYEFLGNADGQLVIVGQEGQFGSRRLDLWGSALVTTMLSSEWHSEDVTDLNCIVARVGIQDGVASSDKFIIDTQRMTLAATGTLDLVTEELNLIFAPRPKRTTLMSLANPAHVTGTLSRPEVTATVLPRNRMAAAGSGLLAGLINPGYLIFTFSQTGSGQANACEAAVAKAVAMKTGKQNQIDEAPAKPARRFSLLPGCTRSVKPTEP